MVYIEIAALAVLIVLNGFLSMSELAIVSSRIPRLKTLAEQQAHGARRALALASDPGRFFSAVQLGITLVGVLSGAFSGATLGLRLSAWLEERGFQTDVAEALGVGLIVALITYASLVVGELVPKQIALRDPESIALRVAPAMTWLATIASPLVSLLDLSGRALLMLLGQRAQAEEQITEEEIKTVIAEAESAGVLEPDERRMIGGVMRLGGRPVIGVMTPRAEVDWIDLKAGTDEIRRQLVETKHSHLPAGEGAENILGVVHARELLASVLSGQELDARSHLRQAPIVYDTAKALHVLEVLRESPVPMALVYDEYGNFEGIVTPADMMEAIAGVFQSDTDEAEPPAIQREDGSWLLAGYLPADEMADLLKIELPQQRMYHTVAGYLLAHFGRLPRAGEHVDIKGWRFEVVDLDGRRIDKVLASRSHGARRRVA